MEKLRENEKINEKVKSQGRPQYIDVNVPGRNSPCNCMY